MIRHASMNRIYRLLWNQARSAWVVVSEIRKARGKPGRTRSTSVGGVAAAALTLAFLPLVSVD